jgi:RNA polymerase sigma-B factor
MSQSNAYPLVRDSVARERALLLRYHLHGDTAAREELVERFMPLVHDLAKRYAYSDEPFDDLLQVASLGLLKAIDRFDPARGSKFTSYAAPTILGELKRHFRDQGWALHVSRDLQERSLAVGRQRERLSKELRRSPTVRELAEALGTSVESVLEAAEASSAYEARSLDVPVSRDDGDSDPLVDLIGAEDYSFQQVERSQALSSTWQELAPVEQEIVRLRFTEDLTQREIGERVGYSQMHVSRLLRRAVQRLETATAAA